MTNFIGFDTVHEVLLPQVKTSRGSNLLLLTTITGYLDEILQIQSTDRTQGDTKREGEYLFSSCALISQATAKRMVGKMDVDAAVTPKLQPTNNKRKHRSALISSDEEDDNKVSPPKKKPAVAIASSSKPKPRTSLPAKSKPKPKPKVTEDEDYESDGDDDGDEDEQDSDNDDEPVMESRGNASRKKPPTSSTNGKGKPKVKTEYEDKPEPKKDKFECVRLFLIVGVNSNVDVLQLGCREGCEISWTSSCRFESRPRASIPSLSVRSIVRLHRRTKQLLSR